MAPKSSPVFSVDLGSNGGVIAPINLNEFVEVSEAEFAEWAWLAADDLRPRFSGIVDHVLGRLRGIVSFATHLKTVGEVGSENPAAVLRGHYEGDTPYLYHSNSATGRALLAMRSSPGPAEAALAYSLLTGQFAVDLRNPNHLRVLTLAAQPGLIATHAMQTAVEQSYKKIRDQARSLASLQRKLLADSEIEWVRFTSAADNRLSIIRRLVTRKGIRVARKLALSANESIGKIDTTRAAYENLMQLKAAVQYWGEKKTGHSSGRALAYKNLVRFIIGSAIVASALFVFAFIVLLELSGVNLVDFLSFKAEDGKPVGSTASIVIAAAIGSIITALFWTARILVRIYTNERRWEGDAEERRIMTQTYLALIKEGAAQDGDRLVILNALFRPTSDGSGSDDGPGEVALPALIAKLMDRR